MLRPTLACSSHVWCCACGVDPREFTVGRYRGLSLSTQRDKIISKMRLLRARATSKCRSAHTYIFVPFRFDAVHAGHRGDDVGVVVAEAVEQ